MLDRSSILFSMNRLSNQKRTQVVRCLIEGNSIRATVRMTDVAKNTVSKLLVDLGSACSEYQNEVMRDLPCQRVQADEIWATATQSKRTSRTNTERHSVMAMFGLGPP